MSDKDRVEINVTVLDEQLRLVLPGDGWTYEEAKMAKNVSEGMSPAQIEGSLLEGDPDAWMAVLRVSFLRDGRDFPSARVAGVNLIELMTELGEATREAIRKRPPTNSSQNGSEQPAESAVPVLASPSSA